MNEIIKDCGGIRPEPLAPEKKDTKKKCLSPEKGNELPISFHNQLSDKNSVGGIPDN